MSYIASWLNDAHQAKAADLVIEDTLTNLKKRSKLLDGYVPFKTYSSRKFLAYVMEEINTVASIISYGSEPPTTQHGTFRKITAELLKSGLSYVYDEEKMWHMKEAMEEAAAKGISVNDSFGPDGKRIRGTNQDLASFLFGTIEQIAKAQIELLDLMTWQALQTGTISRVDPRTNITTEITFKNQYDTSYNHFPDPLTGTARWDQYSTANGLQNLYDAVDTYTDTNGYDPDAIVMSRKLYNHLLQQQSTKDAASSLTVAQVGTVSPDMMDALLRARGIPPIVRFDEQYKNELSNKTTANTRFLNDNRFVFMAKNMGQRAMGPTLENEGQTGIYVVTREIEKVPPVDATQGVATILPVFPDPKLFYSQQVKDA